MKALVFGANGYLGRHIVHAAGKRGWEVKTTDIQRCAWNDDPAYQCCDIRDAEALTRDLDWDVDVVFIFGGLSGTVDSFDNFADYIDVNIKGLVGILEAVRRTGCRAKVVYPSSRLVYRGNSDCELVEDDVEQANTVYAATKLAAEQYLGLYRRIFGLRFTVFRIGIPYGNCVESGYSYGTMEFLLRYAQRGENIPIYGDGLQKRTFSHIEDICEQIFKVISLHESDGMLLNVDGGDNAALCEAAALVAEKYGVSLQSVPWPELALKCETGDSSFNCAAIRSLSGYRCRHNLAEWVRDCENVQLAENADAASGDIKRVLTMPSGAV